MTRAKKSLKGFLKTVFKCCFLDIKTKNLKHGFNSYNQVYSQLFIFFPLQTYCKGFDFKFFL